jgi:hypothetical protein
MAPEETRKALEWLSRGLKEAMIQFIDQAKDSSYGLRASFYEFEYQEVLQKFKEAYEKCGDVKIIYDSRQQAEKNDHAIKEVGLSEGVCIPRKEDPEKISHNKFIILLKDGEPIEVWTGSTKITEKGIFGQCNTGHIVRNRETAKKYLRCWEELKNDPLAEKIKEATISIQQDLKALEISDEITAFFSPRTKSTILKTYADLLDSATELACGVFPFSSWLAVEGWPEVSTPRPIRKS